MVLSKRAEIPCSNIFLDGEKLDQINQLNYLGSLFTSDCRCDKEIGEELSLPRRLLQRREAFLQARS